jgi:ribosomal-protein-serine acetyltransferase
VPPRFAAKRRGVIRIDDDVALEPLRAEHAVACAALIAANRERLVRWMPWAAESRTAADVLRYVEAVDDYRARDAGDAFAVLVRGVFAGAIDLHDLNRTNDVAAIGYWLGETFGGRGVMTRAVRAIAERAFRHDGVHRLEILAAAENAPSRAVAERAGFRLEAILRGRLRTQVGYQDGALYVRFPDDRA